MQDPQADDAPAEELKLVISIQRGQANIGVHCTQTDPIITTFPTGDAPQLMECIPDPVTPAGDRWRFNSRGRRECGVVLDGRRIYTETNRRRAQGVRKFLERFSEGPWGASPSTLRQLLEHNDRLPDAPVSAPVPVIDQGRLQARRRRYMSRIGPVATYSTNNRTNATAVVALLGDIHP